MGWSSMPHHSCSLGGLGGIWLWEPVVPARPRWAPGRGRTQHGEVTACGCCLAGAAVRTRNYGFRLARGNGAAGEPRYQHGQQRTAPWHGNRRVLPASSLWAGGAGRGTDRQVSDPGLSPSRAFHQNTPTKHSSVKALPSSCLGGAQPSLRVPGQKKQPGNVSFAAGLQLCTTSHNGRLGPPGTGRDICRITCF